MSKRKKKLCTCTDQQTEFKWKALNEFADKFTFAELKEELIDYYPDVQMAGKGTLTASKVVCRESSELLESDCA